MSCYSKSFSTNHNWPENLCVIEVVSGTKSFRYMLLCRQECFIKLDFMRGKYKMKISRAILSCLLLSVAVFSLLSPAPGYGWQPALKLPAWLDLGVRFTALPYPGKETTIIGDIYTLVGTGEKATVTFELPAGFSIVSGDKSQVINLYRGRRKRIIIKVRSDKPCGKSQIKMVVTADYPLAAMKKEIKLSTPDREVRAKRMSLAESLAGKRTVSFVKKLFISENEIFLSDKDVLWPTLQKVPSFNGSFFARAFYDVRDIKEVKNRLRQFEHYERLLKSKGNVDSLFSGKHKLKRLKRIAEYGEDLYALATYFYRNRSADRGRMKKLVDKASSYSEINTETVIALKNLLALTNVQAGETVAAVKIWAKLGEKASTGTFGAYMLYNAGEALRGMKKRNESVDFFRAALVERQGLLIARERLRNAFVK